MIFSVNFCQDNHCKLHLHKDHKCQPPPLLHPHHRIGLRSTSQQRKVEDTESPQRTSRHASPRHVALNTSDTISFVETLQSHFLEALYRSLWRPQTVVPWRRCVFTPTKSPRSLFPQGHKVSRCPLLFEGFCTCTPSFLTGIHNVDLLNCLYLIYLAAWKTRAMTLPGYSKSHTNCTHTIGKGISILHRNKTTQSTSRDVGQETKCNPQPLGRVTFKNNNITSSPSPLLFFKKKTWPKKKLFVPFPLLILTKLRFSTPILIDK